MTKIADFAQNTFSSGSSSIGRHVLLEMHVLSHCELIGIRGIETEGKTKDKGELREEAISVEFYSGYT